MSDYYVGQIKAEWQVKHDEAEAIYKERRKRTNAAEDAIRREGLPVTLRRRRWIDGVVSAAMEEPRIEIRWLIQRTNAALVVGKARALSYPGRRIVVIPALRTDVDLASAFHEIGHQRRLDVRSTLHKELAAWQWAREHAPDWSETMDGDMVKSLCSYIAGCGPSDAIGVMDVERATSANSFREERQRRLMLELRLPESEQRRRAEQRVREDAEDQYARTSRN